MGTTVLVAITGASGAAYGLSLVRELLERGLSVDLIVSKTGAMILRDETGIDQANPDWLERIKGPCAAGGGDLRAFAVDDIPAPPASGSALRRVMVVAPCSMGTLGRIASGVSHNLIDRAADCVLKERGTLVLVPRETPISAIHLENMLRLSRAGAVILPAMPAFYHNPQGVADMVNFVVGKVLDVLGIENDLYKRWKG